MLYKSKNYISGRHKKEVFACAMAATRLYVHKIGEIVALCL